MPKIARLALLLIPLVLPGASHAQAERLFAGYAIEWQGLPIGAFETELLNEEGTYRVTYRARTTGFLGWLYPFSSEGSSEGTRVATQHMPHYYDGASRRRDDSSSWAVRFHPDGRAIRVDVPAEDRIDREPVPPALQVAPDPLALALGAIGAAAPGAQLTGTSFDGRRALRFEVACGENLVALADAPPGAAAAAEREALACTVDGELAAGASRRWKGRSMRDEGRAPVAVWLGRGVLEDAFWPVRVEAPTRYGTVTVRLVSLQPAAGATPSN
ncbi:MAG: DUF3108 domain-containing protein [Geminicoccaceae bacterium]